MFAHVDLDAFFASVEQVDDPTLVGRCVAVVNGTVVTSASYPARAAGVRAAMPLTLAQRLCPDLAVVAGRIDRYRAISKRFVAILERFGSTTPMSIDEAYVDLGPAADPSATATEIRAAVSGELSLSCSVGVAAGPTFAKMASASAKPDGVAIIPMACEASWLAYRPVSQVFGIGRRSAGKLAAAGVDIVADLDGRSVDDVARLIGRSAASRLLALAAGEDTATLDPHRARRQISSQTVLAPCAIGDCTATLARLAVDVCAQARRSGVWWACVTLRWRDQAGETHTRSRTGGLCGDPAEVWETVKTLLGVLDRRTKVNLVGVGLSGLSSPPLTLFTLLPARSAALERFRFLCGLDRGDAVTHPMFGRGFVVDVSAPYVTAEFSGVQRTIDVRHVALVTSEPPAALGG